MTVQSFLTRLIGLCLLPLVLLAAYLAIDHVRTLQAELDREATDQVRNFTAAVDREIKAQIRVLQLLAASPRLDDPPRLDEFYGEALGFRNTYGAHVILADTSMQMLLNTRTPFGTALPKLPRPRGHAAAPIALATGKPAVGDIVLGPVAGEKLVALAVPVLREGQVRYLLLSTLETRHFQQRLEEFILPAKRSLALLDSGNETIARRPLDSDPPADGAPPPKRFVAQSGISPWSVVLEVAPEVYRAPVLLAAVVLGVAILAAVLISMLIGRLAGRRLVRSVETLADPVSPSRPSGPVLAEIEAIRRRLADAEAALRESEARFRHILETTLEGVFTVDADFRITYVNSRMCDLLGYSREDLLGRTPSAFIAEESRALALEGAERRRAGQAEQFELQLLRRDGSPMWALFHSAPTVGPDDRFAGAVVMMMDITARKQAADLIAGQKEVLERIATGAPLNAVLAALVQVIERQVPGMRGSVLLLDPDGVHVRHAAAPSLPESFIQAIDGEPIGARAGSCGTAMYRREPVIVEDILTDPLWEQYRAAAARHGLRACWSTPIVDSRQRVLGSFAMYYSVPCRPAQQHLKLIEVATDLAAIAITRDREQSALRELSRRLLQVQEEERRAIARELHDRIGQNLSALHLNFNIIRSQLPGELQQRIASRLDDAQKLLETTARMVRDVMAELRPPALDELGLAAALRQHAREVSLRSGIAIDVEGTEPSPRLDPTAEIALFRIAQEALNNTVKHAQAAHVTMAIHDGDGRVELRIEDDGVGFDATAPRSLDVRSLGIAIMRERAEAIGAAFRVESAPGKGTRVVVEVPRGA